MTPIPYARQSISEEDIAAVVAALRSDWLTQGPRIAEFEQGVATYCGARHAVAVSSGTAALHLACLALGLGAGDLFWTSPNTFAATANCARYCGAQVDFVDIDPRTGNLSAEALEEKLRRARAAGRLPKVLAAVHFAGHPCDMPAIRRLTREFGVRLIEDASHALGAQVGPERVGGGQHADATVFSFHAVKVLTTAEGGMVTTADDALAAGLRLLRTHGITREPSEMDRAPDGPWYYQQIALGFNYRMTDVQAALGCSQLSRLELFLARRRELARRYGEALGSAPVSVPVELPGVRSTWHLYVVRVGQATGAPSRREVFERMRARQVLVNVHYIPVHLHPYYQALGFRQGDFPESERFYAHSLTLPLYFGLSDAEQDRVCTALLQSVA